MRRQRALLGASLLALAAVLVALLAGGSGSPAARRATAAATVPAGAAGTKSGGGAGTTAAASGGAGSARGASGAQPASAGSLGYPESAEVRRLIALGRPIYCAPPRGDEVALTFDDGPGVYTKLMIAKLQKHHVGATFFLVGRNLGLLPGVTRVERSLGAVGDHTWTHPLLTALPLAEAEAQIARTQQAVAAASAGSVFLFRPPYGAHDPAIDAAVKAHGLLEILWNVDSRDSLGASYAQIEQTVVAGLRPGSIILMHENHGQTIRAMLTIFAALAKRRLHAVSVPQLLTDDPPSPTEVLAGGSACGLSSSAKLGGN